MKGEIAGTPGAALDGGAGGLGNAAFHAQGAPTGGAAALTSTTVATPWFAASSSVFKTAR